MPVPTLALCLEYPIFAFGGTEVLVGELLRRLGDEWRVILVSADETLAGTWAEPLVSVHHRWDSTRPDAAAQLVSQLKENKAALAHFHLGGNFGWSVRNPARCPIVLAAERGLRCITTNHGFFSGFEGYCAHYRPFAMKLALLPFAWVAKLRQLRAVAAEVAVSQHDYRALRRWYGPMRDRFRQIYHAKLPAKLPDSALTKEKVIVCVGTIGPRKGQPFLVEAFARIAPRHPGWRLELAGRAGDAAMMDSIRRTIKTQGLNERVSFRSDLDDAAIAQRLATAEIFAMPSLHEGLGLSLQEALFHGCACVASRAGGIVDLIDDGANGLLVPRGDVPALAAALERLMADDALRARLRAAGPASIRAKRMSGEEMTDAYRKLYREVA